MNFYAVLGIPADANDETIRGAYKILARRYHPDIGSGSSTEEFRRVAEAYETLIDPGRRRLYDLSLLPIRAGAVAKAEPMIRRPETSCLESPDIFGRPSGRPRGSAVSNFGIESLLEEFMRSFENDFLKRG